MNHWSWHAENSPDIWKSCPHSPNYCEGGRAKKTHPASNLHAGHPQSLDLKRPGEVQSVVHAGTEASIRWHHYRREFRVSPRLRGYCSTSLPECFRYKSFDPRVVKGDCWHLTEWANHSPHWVQVSTPPPPSLPNILLCLLSWTLFKEKAWLVPYVLSPLYHSDFVFQSSCHLLVAAKSETFLFKKSCQSFRQFWSTH